MVRSTERALEILEIVGANKKSLKHGEIAKALRIPKSTLTKLLTSLVNKDYLTVDPISRTYSIGPQVLFLANTYLASLDIIQVAQPIIREAMEKGGESASLMIKRGENGLIICKENSAKTIVVARLIIGARVPLYATAGGKAILAFLDADELEQYLSSVKLAPLTPTTITDRKVLLGELKTIREKGIAHCNGEQFEDLFSISAPVFGWDGRVVASISMPFPKIRLNAENEKTIEEILRKSSAEISRKLGLNVNSLPLTEKLILEKDRNKK